LSSFLLGILCSESVVTGFDPKLFHYTTCHAVSLTECYNRNNVLVLKKILPFEFWSM
jgi:hypothetical protein